LQLSLLNPNKENKFGLVGTIFFLSEFFDFFPLVPLLNPNNNRKHIKIKNKKIKVSKKN
jgi:hypothetical protein